ncbi:hypothetical protein PALB_7210 [Pseudoalteromonas luteoviolacea B = ATCC 29581]|nr:hypothetical protein PALB_7210 [Pseudoalteromonas luteoviolacea B = ATCC 29581]
MLNKIHNKSYFSIILIFFTQRASTSSDFLTNFLPQNGFIISNIHGRLAKNS